MSKTDGNGPLVRFYREENPDGAGRKLSEILAWDDEQLEEAHDYIQWLFPLKERSQYNSDAPVLDAAQISVFQSDEDLKGRLLAAFRRMLAFYGFDYREEANGQPRIEPASNWTAQSANWLQPYNHNFLRITRILTSLRLLGLPEPALAFYRALETLYRQPEAARVIGEKTFSYWSSAAGQA